MYMARKILVIVLGIGGIFITGGAITEILVNQTPEQFNVVPWTELVAGLTLVVLVAYLYSLPSQRR